MNSAEGPPTPGGLFVWAFVCTWIEARVPDSLIAMKPLRWIALLALVCAAAGAVGQDVPSASIRSEHWLAGVFVGGGSGLYDRANVQFIRTGVRVGRVMTGELGGGNFRGTFELDAEVMPVDMVLWGEYKKNEFKPVYGFAVNPLVMKWNFTRDSSRRLIPYFLAQGGVIFTAVNVPPGDTSKINFTSGAGVGFNYFIRPRRSVSFDFRATHLSSASLGNHNPGVNSSLQISLGYNWWKK